MSYGGTVVEAFSLQGSKDGLLVAFSAVQTIAKRQETAWTIQIKRRKYQMTEDPKPDHVPTYLVNVLAFFWSVMSGVCSEGLDMFRLFFKHN